jgi:hypothetical protein
MISDRIWQARQDLPPLWGVYEIGVLSPLIRVFFPHSTILWDMNEQLKATEVYGFFPSSWGAAFLDFGEIGGALYVFFWGLIGGWAYYTCRRANLVLPPTLLSWVLSSVLLSPLQGPLGMANSALVLVSVFALGLFVDVTQLRLNKTGLIDPSLDPAVLKSESL